MKRLQRGRKLTLLPLILVVLLSTGCSLWDRLKARDHLNKGVKAYTAQKFEEAAKDFQQAVDLDPQLVNARLYLAAAYRQQWVPGIPSKENLAFAEKAIQSFEDVLQQDPENLNAIANIASIYAQNDEPEKAKEWYRRRIEVDPDDPEPYYGIGTLDWKTAHDMTGINGDAVESLSEEERAKAHQVIDEGVAALEKALEKDQNHFEAMQYLNLLYRERSYLAQDEEEKKKWEKEALRLSLKALDLQRQETEKMERQRHTFGGKKEGE